MKRGFVLVLAAIGLAACAGGDDDEAATTTTTEQVASVEHIATAIARGGPGVAELIDQVGVCFTLDDPRCTSTTYGLDYLSLQLSAQALALEMQGVVDPGQPGYQGPVPDEIKGLYNSTFAAAQQLDYALDAFLDGCVDPSAPNCTTLNSTVQFNAQDLDSELAAWGPYL